MAIGILSAVAMASPKVLPNVVDIYKFPIILVVSLIAALLGTFLTKPDEEAILKEFYRRVRPWGFWGPVREKVMAENPGFQRNKDFWRDMFNIVIGTIWQCCFILLAMYLVTRRFRNTAITFVVLAVTCFILKKTWYDRLPAPSPEPVVEPQTRPSEVTSLAGS
jgi:peptidoglycan/LPS O-acetylase OafA/YrhL